MEPQENTIFQYGLSLCFGSVRIREKRQPFLRRKFRLTHMQILGYSLLALGLGGMIGPLLSPIRLNTAYAITHAQTTVQTITKPTPDMPKSAPIVFNPLIAPDGSPITPVNQNFSLIIPAINVNAPVLTDVNPANPGEYGPALLQGVAHASTSMLPNQDGTVYLFSHSTSYEWFVKDLNAVFFLLKNLKEGDLVVLVYHGKIYTYKIREKKIVSPSDVSYLVPLVGKKSLILQTCWPPGTTNQRLLLFADFIQ